MKVYWKQIRQPLKLKIKRYYLFIRKLTLSLFSFLLFWQKRIVFLPADVKKILVIRIDRIGDVVLSTPTLRALREHFPQAHIALMLRPETEALLLENPSINEIIIYEKRGFIESLRFILDLRKRRFDLAIDLIWDYPLKSALLVYLSGAKYRLGYDIAGRGIFFNVRVTSDKKDKHTIERTLDVVRTVGVDTPNREPEIVVSSQSKKAIYEFLSQHNISQEDLVVGIHPGGHYPTQRWSKEGFARVGDEIAKRYGAKVIIVGSSGETELVQGVVGLMETEPVNMAGTSLEQLIALIDRCYLFICNNSGPLHIAVALKTPTVSTMGPTIPQRWWPIGDNHMVIRKDLPCSPCNLGYCPRETHDCMRLITPEEVIETVKRQMKELKRDR